jgi:iron complex outermembrane receptor protein
VYSPDAAFSLGVDFYRIDIDDRVVFSGNFTGPRVEALVRPVGANGGRFFTNAIDTRTLGADVTATYTRDLGRAGRLSLAAAYNRTDNDIAGAIQTPPQLAGLENVLFDRTETLRLTCGQPRDNTRLSASWRRGRLGSVMRASRYGEYCFATNTPANDQTFGARWLADVQLSYTSQGWTVAVGADNVFNAFPDALSPANSSFQVQTFPATSPFGFNGRFLYSRLSVRF